MIQDILTYFDAMIDTEASDLYLTAGSRPTMRVDDALQTIGETSLAEKDIQNIISSLLSLRQVREFEMHKEFVFSHSAQSAISKSSCVEDL
mgnify:CR=1 FL=1